MELLCSKYGLIEMYVLNAHFFCYFLHCIAILLTRVEFQ